MIPGERATPPPVPPRETQEPREERERVREVHFQRLPLSLPCPVPVLPGSPDTLDADGEAIPLEDRTEACAVDAWWTMGHQITCDVHLRQACSLLGIDYDGLLDEAGGPRTSEGKPWAERHRYAQESATKGPPWESA